MKLLVKSLSINFDKISKDSYVRNINAINNRERMLKEVLKED